MSRRGRPKILELLAEGEGFCCPWAFLQCCKGSHLQVAWHLGVFRSTVARWRREAAEGKIYCEMRPGCFAQLPPDQRCPKVYGQIPRRPLPPDVAPRRSR